MQPDSTDTKRRRRILILIIMAVTAVVIGLVALSGKAVQRYPVNIVIIPSDSTLEIDGRKTPAGEVQLAKGVHVLVGSRQYFGSVRKTIDVVDKSTGDVFLPLTADSAEAKKYILDHPSEQALYLRAAGDDFEATQTLLSSTYPVLAKLPYESIDYSINYTVDEQKKVSFQVKLHPAKNPSSSYYKTELEDYKAEALEFLRFNDVDVNTEKISFSPDPAAL